MRILRLPTRTILTAMTLTVVGCSPAPDPRLAELASQSLAQQARQNEQMAQQSQTVVQHSQRLTEAAQALVEKDAVARQELIQAQHQLHAGVATERANVDRQREAMETERRELATQRGRDPIIAETVRGACVLVACLFPLLICWYVLRHLGADANDHEALGELLVSELTSKRPLFLPLCAAPVQRLEGPVTDPPAEEDPASVEKPS